MDKWVEELREKVKNDSRLMCPYISYFPDEYDDINIITLDGKFTIEQLKTIINHMKKYSKE